MLKTETNTPEMERRVLAAAQDKLSNSYSPQPLDLTAFFEHGQWWIEASDTGAQWSVVDAEGPSAIDGFDFEQVTQGEEERSR